MPRERRRLSPDTAQQWIRIAKYGINAVVGWGLLIWQGVFVRPPSPTAVGAALALIIGYPAVELLRNRNHNNNDPPEDGGSK